MKTKNTIFFGAMAAILMAAGSANAAVTQIASTEYVDSIAQTKADASDVSDLTSDVSTLKTNVSGLQTDVSGIDTKIGTGTMTVGGNAVDTIVGAINALDAQDVDAYTKAEADAAFAAKDDLGALAELDTVGADQIDANAVTTAKVADKAITKAKLDQGVQDTLDAALTSADLTDYVTDTQLTSKGYATETWVGNQNYIPKPSPACTAGSGTCVLTVATNGTMAWMNVADGTVANAEEGE